MAQNQATMMNPAPAADSTTKNENIYTAQANLATPQKVSNRPVEPVPANNAQALENVIQNQNKVISTQSTPLPVQPASAAVFDKEKAQSMVDFARGNAATGTVSGDSLVQNQLSKVLASDSPLLARARTSGLASSAERGLNNTSIGVQAGEEAMIGKALQIATPDAETYGAMDRANQNSAANQALAGTQQAFTDYNNDKQNYFTSGENQKTRELQSYLQKDQQGFTSGENLLDRAQRQDLFDKGNEFTSGENKLTRDQQLAIQSGDHSFQSSENKLTRDQQADLQESQQKYGATQAEASDARQLAANKELGAIRAKQDVALEDIRFDHQQTINTNATAATVFANHQNAVAQIMANPNMTPSQAGVSIKVLNATTNTNLDLLGKLDGVDLSGFKLNTEVGGSTTTNKDKTTTNDFTVSSGSSGQQQNVGPVLPQSPPPSLGQSLSEAESRKAFSRGDVYK